MSILQQREVKTAADLVALLAPLGERPLTQIITVAQFNKENEVEDWYNQIEYFVWDTEKKKLEVQI